MRAFLPVFFLILSCGLYAQVNIAFKIITLTPGVSINGKPVTAGLDVQESDDQLIIPNGGHVGLITADGHPYRLVNMSMAVSKVNQFVKEHPIKRHRGEWYANELLMPLVPVNQFSETLGDSVFLFWIPGDYFRTDLIPRIQPPFDRTFTVRFSNMYDDSLAGSRVDRNWIVTKYPPSDLKKEKNKAVLYQVTCWSPKAVSDMHYINKASEKTKDYVRSLLAPLESHSDREYLRCAFFDLNNFKLDMNMSLYRIIARGLTTTDPILKKYLANQIAENNLELMDLER